MHTVLWAQEESGKGIIGLLKCSITFPCACSLWWFGEWNLHIKVWDVQCCVRWARECQVWHLILPYLQANKSVYYCFMDAGRKHEATRDFITHSRVIARASYWIVPVIHASHHPGGQCRWSQAGFVTVIGLHYRGGVASCRDLKPSRSKPALCLWEVLPHPSVFLVQNKALKNSMDNRALYSWHAQAESAKAVRVHSRLLFPRRDKQNAWNLGVL